MPNSEAVLEDAERNPNHCGAAGVHMVQQNAIGMHQANLGHFAERSRGCGALSSGFVLVECEDKVMFSR